MLLDIESLTKNIFPILKGIDAKHYIRGEKFDTLITVEMRFTLSNEMWEGPL